MTFVQDASVLVSLLASMCDRLAETVDEGQVAGVVLPAVADGLGARLATLALLSGERTVRVLSTVGMPESTTGPWVEFDVSAAVPLAGCLREDVPVWLTDVEGARDAFPALPRPTASASLCAVPLRHEGRVMGALGVGWAERHEFDCAERHALLTIAGLAAAAVAGEWARENAAPRPGLSTHTHDTPAGASVACLSRPQGARCALHAARPGAAPGPLFVSLLDADPALPPRTVDAVGGVLALSRRRALPPAVVAEAVADMAEDLDGPVTGAHVEVDPGSGWVAVAALDRSAVIVSHGHSHPGAPARPGADIGAAAQPSREQLVLAGAGPAVVLAVALDRRLGAGEADVVTAACRRTVDELTTDADAADDTTAGHEGDLSALQVVTRLAETLRRHEADACVRGALAVVVPAPAGLTQRARTLPAVPTSALLARRFATAVLPRDAGTEVAGEVALVTDELVTNAARHAHPEVRVVVTDEPDGTRLAVSDDDDRDPEWLDDALLRDREREDAAAAAESGRGLTIVDALADQTGTTARPGGGKYVWARLAWRRRG